MKLLRMLQRNATSCCTNGRTKVNCRALMQCVCLLLLLGVIVEIILLHFVLYYIYSSSKEMLQAFGSVKGSFMDKLLTIDVARNAIKIGKNGGISSLMENTLDRLYLMPVPLNREVQDTTRRSNIIYPQAELYVLGVDVSEAGEALYVYKKILRRRKFPYARLVVDIGANDGFLSSNSYNFIHWGWSAILVEPQHSQLDLAKKNIERYRGLFPRNSQNITFVEAVIGTRNGLENFVLSSDAVNMESHVLKSSDSHKFDIGHIMKVPSMTVRTFTEEHNVPQYFGVLSLDAEGMGDKILHQWINLNFRPAYIIYEQLHNSEPFEVMLEYLENVGYACISKRGWNYIFEYKRR
ncbi:uncharacterized protein LOC135476555 [Liolophura sinensis]|uniref:uncharacterized protein LOC135476555 n=1 Tax=Liolophura sinensis TaxID=3198878 RepID=UPI0031582A1B